MATLIENGFANSRPNDTSLRTTSPTGPFWRARLSVPRTVDLGTLARRVRSLIDPSYITIRGARLAQPMSVSATQ